MKTADKIIEDMIEEMPFHITISSIPYIKEAMNLYAKQLIVETVEICNCHADGGCFDKDGALTNSLNLIK